MFYNPIKWRLTWRFAKVYGDHVMVYQYLAQRDAALAQLEEQLVYTQ